MLLNHISYLKIARYKYNNLAGLTRFPNCFVKEWKSLIGKGFLRQISHKRRDEQKSCDNFIPFTKIVQTRKEEARRTILVQVQSAKSFKELHSYCSSFGTVTQMLHYTAGVEPMHFILVEFIKEEEVAEVLSKSSHIEDSQAVPIRSPFLWFRATSHKFPKLKSVKNAKLHLENGNCVLKDVLIKERLEKSENISDQMLELYNATKLNDLGTRLRFLIARQVELAICGMFPSAQALPFGSTVNGGGKMGCDLDLVLRLCDKNQFSEEQRLVFHCKASTASERSTSLRHMETIGDLIQLFLPGCSQVRKILQARVPIIKYYQQLADVECDLSMGNMSGVHMSDLLYIMGSVDPRVRPLIFTIRKWAQEVGLTNSSPGRWITNFSLTLLVLGFLQNPNTSQAILPSINTLIKNADASDRYITEDGINCTFLRDINKLSFQTHNNDDLELLLKQFFEFYSSFDFSQKALSLNEGISITKPEHSPLYIVNPLERGLNVSKNVSVEELERFRIEVRNAAWILESEEQKTSTWGLLSMFKNKKVSTSSFVAPNRQGRLVEVSRLFSEEQGNPDEDKIEFKNEEVQKQVNQIKQDTTKKIKDFENEAKMYSDINIRKSTR